KGVGTVEFDMPDERIQTLVACGRNAARNYFNRLNRTSRARTAQGGR
ncbi:MAG: hypothetical protein HUU38_02890, partial [Anaerolineales bacterium]|nr:hypothetical protein [Anaerolineales bacterium]